MPGHLCGRPTLRHKACRKPVKQEGSACHLHNYRDDTAVSPWCDDSGSDAGELVVTGKSAMGRKKPSPLREEKEAAAAKMYNHYDQNSASTDDDIEDEDEETDNETDEDTDEDENDDDDPIADSLAIVGFNGHPKLEGKVNRRHIHTFPPSSFSNRHPNAVSAAQETVCHQKNKSIIEDKASSPPSMVKTSQRERWQDEQEEKAYGSQPIETNARKPRVGTGAKPKKKQKEKEKRQKGVVSDPSCTADGPIKTQIQSQMHKGKGQPGLSGGKAKPSKEELQAQIDKLAEMIAGLQEDESE